MEMTLKVAPLIATVALGVLSLSGCGGQDSEKPVAAVATSPPLAIVPTQPTTKLEFSAYSDRGKILKSGLLPFDTSNGALRVLDSKTGKPVTEFEKLDDELMHLIIVSSDLTRFYCLRPWYKGAGKFNFPISIGIGGKYKLFAEYRPRGRGREVSQFEIRIEDSRSFIPEPKDSKPAPDKMEGGWIKKLAMPKTEAVDDSSDQSAFYLSGLPPYTISLMPMPTPLIAGQEATLHFQVRDRADQLVKDLQPYLSNFGHCVVISQDTHTFLRIVPAPTGAKVAASDGSRPGGAAKGGPDVMFKTTFPSAGLYRVWGEFKHQGMIFTASFMVEVAAAKPGDDTTQ